MKKIFFLFSLACGSLLLSCSASRTMDHSAMMHAQNVSSAVCVLNPTQGSSVRGIVRFTKTDAGIRVVADIEGLTPGKHGFHIHEFGDCSAPDATSAGGHFNPHKMQHGAPDAGERHSGDFGNIEADASGRAHYDRTDANISFEGENNILGHAIIVHANPDDLVTQPTGNAGGRVACGVIGVAK